MSLNNSQLHGFAFGGTIVLAGALFGTALFMTGPAEASHEPPLKEMITIEASLAKKAETKTQPQKELKTPEPPPPLEGVSHDENKPPEKPKPKDDKKPPKPPRPDDKPLDPLKFKHPSDDDPQTGSPTTSIGTFDGSKEGFAQVNAGNPYWQHFVADFKNVWEIPAISKVTGATKACFHIEPDGKIVDTKFEHSGDDTLDDSVQRAMSATKKTRNEKLQPVPTEQLGVLKGWVCFRFTP